MKNIWIALLVLLWLLLGWLMHQKQSQCCDIAISNQNLEEVIIQSPLLFNQGSKSPILAESWEHFRDSLKAGIVTNSVLEIIGKYCTNSSPKETDSLGMQRAIEIRKLFPELSDDKVSISTKAIECDSNTMNPDMEFSSLSIKIRTENIKEIDDKTLIYFPSNSTSKLNSAEVETYLSNVAKRVINSDETITLIGHSDDAGPEDNNTILGQRRADIIKQFLISQGVPSAKISAKSEGEARPIETNSTLKGRSKNRRTELQILKPIKK
jgi:outer membrane protein OmpA-like peptidoglycan-associated protein